MHVGHKYAIHTGEFWRLDKKLKPLKRLWESIPDKLHNKTTDVFFINGEHVDGDNKHELGHQVWSTDINDQFHDARTLLKSFKIKGIGMTRGSNYHTTKDNTSLEEMFANSLSGIAPVLTYNPFGDDCVTTFYTQERDQVAHAMKTRVDDLAVLDINGKIFHLMHHIGGSKWFSYLPTALGREMAQMVFFDGKLWTHENAPSIIVRSHTHRFVHIEYSSQHGCVTPSWKVMDRFGSKNGQDAGLIGMVEFVVEPNGEILFKKFILDNKDYPKLNIVKIQ